MQEQQQEDEQQYESTPIQAKRVPHSSLLLDQFGHILYTYLSLIHI